MAGRRREGEDGAEGGFPMRHILVAVDGSAGSRAAVTEGVELARAAGAAVTFVAVRHGIPLLGKPYYQRKLSEQLARFRPALEEAMTAAADAGVEAEAETLEGDVVESILRVAVYRDVDMIVVGTRELGPVAGAMLGSVSKALVDLAPMPVLVAKTRATAPLATVG
jgi:nucleotide-binding universal stress UspA family protein